MTNLRHLQLSHLHVVCAKLSIAHEEVSAIEDAAPAAATRSQSRAQSIPGSAACGSCIAVLPISKVCAVPCPGRIGRAYRPSSVILLKRDGDWQLQGVQAHCANFNKNASEPPTNSVRMGLHNLKITCTTGHSHQIFTAWRILPDAVGWPGGEYHVSVLEEIRLEPLGEI